MENKEKWCFILNPTAGSGFGNELLPELEKQLTNRSGNPRIGSARSTGIFSSSSPSLKWMWEK